jgi:hypothetical protein
VVTPRLIFFDYFDGVGDDKTHTLERYDYRRGWGGDTRAGVYGGLDLSLVYGNLDRDSVVLDVRGYGQYDYRAEGRYSDDQVNVYGTFGHYRSATGGIDYLFNPNEVPDGTQAPYDVFNDDAGRYDYVVDRTTYGAGLTMKPALLGGWGSITVDYQGYQRDGNKFAPFYLCRNPSGGGGGPGPGPGPGSGNDAIPVADSDDCWRGINLGIDETMNRLAFKLDAAPQDLFNISYQVSLEKFGSDAPDLSFQDLGVATDPALLPNTRLALTPFFYVPDTTLLSQAIQFSKNFDDRFLIALGYSHASLEEDGSHPRFASVFSETDPGPDPWTGKITTDSAFANATWNISPAWSLEGFVKYHQRDNDSAFPVTNVVTAGDLVGPYIQAIDSLDYGLSADWRPDFLHSTFTLGWHRLDRERDLLYGSIDPAQTLYREDTLADELYLKWIARPAMGWTVRLTPSFTWADSTGLVTEPEEAFKLKALVSYAAPEGWLVSGFYDYRQLKNSNNTFTDGADVANPATYSQEIDNTLHAAGVSLNVMPRDNINAFVNLYWVQNDLSSYLFQTTAARWSAGVTFDLIDEPNYQVDTYSLGFGGDWQVSDILKLSASYTYSRSSGDVASGTVLTALQDATGTVDAKIDNSLHSLAIGADYVFNPKATLRASYIYDYYEDDAYSLLTGGVHTLVFGLSYAF